MINYDKWINKAVSELRWYINKYQLKSVVLGLSGGIDSTVSAAICHLVCKDMPDVTFIGRSLPIVNPSEEEDIASMVGNKLCDDFQTVPMKEIYTSYRNFFYINEEESKANNIANGNMMARLRMIYLYQLASHYKGVVIDTDNATEHILGFYTIHGDVGDYNVGIRNLYKHEIWELAERLKVYIPKASDAIQASINLQPTDGNTGGTDMDQIAPGATYKDVDTVCASMLDRHLYLNAIKEYGVDFVDNIERRVVRNEYKNYLPYTSKLMDRKEFLVQ